MLSRGEERSGDRGRGRARECCEAARCRRDEEGVSLVWMEREGMRVVVVVVVVDAPVRGFVCVVERLRFVVLRKTGRSCSSSSVSAGLLECECSLSRKEVWYDDEAASGGGV